MVWSSALLCRRGSYVQKWVSLMRIVWPAWPGIQMANASSPAAREASSTSVWVSFTAQILCCQCPQVVNSTIPAHSLPNKAVLILTCTVKTYCLISVLKCSCFFSQEEPWNDKTSYVRHWSEVKFRQVKVLSIKKTVQTLIYEYISKRKGEPLNKETKSKLFVSESQILSKRTSNVRCQSI